MATLNIGMKVNRAITGATTVNANAYAMVTYNPSFGSYGGNGGSPSSAGGPITRYFGPGQSIPASFSTSFPTILNNGSIGAQISVTWSLQSGVELINTQ